MSPTQPVAQITDSQTFSPTRLTPTLFELPENATINDFRKSLMHLASKYNDVMHEITSMRAENASLVNRVAELEETIVNELQPQYWEDQQQKRSSNIEIHGVAKVTQKEDFKKIVTDTAEKLGVPNFDYDNQVKEAYRINSKTGVWENTQTPTPVIVKLTHKQLTPQWLNKDVKIKSRQCNIFINENLTPRNRFLHIAAKKFAREEEFKFCWVKHGRVFLRKDEGHKAFWVVDEYYLVHIKRLDEKAWLEQETKTK